MLTGYFEDVVVGATARFGHYRVERDAVIAFAAQYDAQPFHLSDEGAVGTPFGRLAASGWHSCAMMMAMTVEHMRSNAHAVDTSLGAIGVDELRWLIPVYPDNVLSCQSEVLETIPSRSRPEMGIVKLRTTVFNQDDAPVMTLKAILMIRTRPQDA
ncbi:MaoC family dehydratase [soil metagenome]